MTVSSLWVTWPVNVNVGDVGTDIDVDAGEDREVGWGGAWVVFDMVTWPVDVDAGEVHEVDKVRHGSSST